MPLVRALGMVIIRRLAPTGLGANAIIRAVRQAGYGYRREDMLSDTRKFTGRVKNEYFIKQISPGDVMPQGLMVETGLRRPVKYQVFGSVTLYDPETDSYKFKDSSFYTDNLRSKEDWEGDFIDIHKGLYEEEGLGVVGFETRAIEHNEGYGY